MLMKDLEEIMLEKIKDYRASGKTLPAYCAENGLTIDKMKYWMYARNKPKRKQAASGIQKKGIKSFVSYGLPDAGKQETGLVLEIKGVTIALKRGFDKVLLREAVEALLS